MLSLVLTREDVARNTEALTLLHELRSAIAGGEAALSVPAVAVRVDTPTRSMIHLHEPQPSGKLLAAMDATALTQLRSQLVAAIAADALSAPEAKRVAILGGGPLANGILKSLRLVRSLREVFLVAADPTQGFVQAAQLQLTLKTPIRAVDTAADAVANVDIVVLTEGVALPEVALWPSVHLCVPNVTRFATCPFTPGVLAKSFRVSDGDAPLWGQPVHASLAAVLSDPTARQPGNPLFAGSDAPWLDLVAAWHVYEGAQHDEAVTRTEYEA